VPSSEFELVQLGNGTYSVRSIQYDETFHPVIGPVAEAEALYVRQLRLAERLEWHSSEFVIWDVGLGAAANTIAALRATRHLGTPIHLLSFDQTTQPLLFALEHAPQLRFLAGYEKEVRGLLESGARPYLFRNGAQPVRWELCLGNFPTFLNSADAERLPKPHAILFDAYSPATNPEMWTGLLFRRLFQLLDPKRPCSLATYSRSTMLRVTLLLAGFFAGKGDATGEKEETTIAANTLELIADPLDSRWLRRARNSTSAEPLEAAVYRQAPLSAASWDRLRNHPQFQAHAHSTPLV
jgi:queuine tRNA-ribosyltransferase